jgi:hypothetical protein
MPAYWHFALLPGYAGILTFCSFARICRHTDILLFCQDMRAYWNTCDSRYHLVTWCANKLKYLRPEI